MVLLHIKIRKHMNNLPPLSDSTVVKLLEIIVHFKSSAISLFRTSNWEKNQVKKFSDISTVKIVYQNNNNLRSNLAST